MSIEEKIAEKINQKLKDLHAKGEFEIHWPSYTDQAGKCVDTHLRLTAFLELYLTAIDELNRVLVEYHNYRTSHGGYSSYEQQTALKKEILKVEQAMQELATFCTKPGWDLLYNAKWALPHPPDDD